MPDALAVSGGRVVRTAISITTLLFVGLAANAQGPGRFVPTGSMTTPRAEHTATLLLDGRVLIVGGGPETAEIYDPASGTFTSAGAVHRHVHSATLLLDGKVLLAGGFDSSGHPSASADLFDPVTNTLTPTNSLLESQFGQQATLLRDGRIFIAAGKRMVLDPSDGHWKEQTARAELYDPTTGTFSFAAEYAGDIGKIDGGVTTAALRDGRVLVSDPRTLELYDPLTDTFKFSASVWMWSPTATTLNDGTVLFTFGEGDWCEATIPPAMLYNPVADTFANTGSMIEARMDRTPTVLRDGSVLFTGGGGYTCNVTNSAELYLPATKTFIPVSPMIQSRRFHTATLLRDGSVLITGGYATWGPGPGAVLASAEIYRPLETGPRRRGVRH